MASAASLKVLTKKWFPQSLVFRRALCTATAVFIAVYVDRYYSLLHEFWVCLATVLVLQMTVRTNVRQEMLRLMVVLLSVLLGSLLAVYLSHSGYLNFFLIFIFITGCFIHNYFPSRSGGFSPPLMVALISLLMIVPFARTSDVLFARLHDVVLGGLIGLVAGVIIFPGRADVDFRVGVIPVLHAYSLYLSAITQLLFKVDDAALTADKKKIAVEKVLQSRQAFFPAWVYERGFTASLQKGHRHFLLRVEQMGQVLFAMNYHARFTIDPALLDRLREPILRCVDSAKVSINDLITVLNEAEVTMASSEFKDELSILEDIFYAEMAMPFELIETSADYIHTVGFIYGLKDLQRILAQLEESLRAYLSRLSYSQS